jgi:Putative amidase domain
VLEDAPVGKGTLATRRSGSDFLKTSFETPGALEGPFLLGKAGEIASEMEGSTHVSASAESSSHLRTAGAELPPHAHGCGCEGMTSDFALIEKEIYPQSEALEKLATLPAFRMALLTETAASICSGQVDETIRGWGQYENQIALLPGPEQSKISKIAELIVTSFIKSGCIPLGQITIIGHADNDFHGPNFEKKVSYERATSVAAALGSAIIAGFKKRGIRRIAKGAIAFIPTPDGVGATQPDPANIPQVKDRALNRRVEIRIRQRGAPVPPPDTLERRIVRFLDLLKSKKVDPDLSGKRTDRARCILNKMLRPGVLDLFVDGTAANATVGTQRVSGNLCSFQGTYDPPPSSTTDLAKFLGTVSAVLKGPGFAPAVPDGKILSGLSSLIFMINEGIVRVERYITLNSSDFGYTGDKTRGIRLSSIFADHLNDENSIYSCYKDFHGNESETQTETEALNSGNIQENLADAFDGRALRRNSFELDPYATIRSAMSPAHANLASDEITLILGRTPAALVLHQFVNSPEMRLATLASLLGKSARRSVQVNGSDIPITAYLQLVSRLCREVAEQSETEGQYIREIPKDGKRTPAQLADIPPWSLEKRLSAGHDEAAQAFEALEVNEFPVDRSTQAMQAQFSNADSGDLHEAIGISEAEHSTLYNDREDELAIAFEPSLEEVLDPSAPPRDVADALTAKKWALALSLAIQAGVRDENELANLIFFAKHAELPRVKLDPQNPNFKQLSGEWLQILNVDVWTAIQASSENASLAVSGSEVADIDRFFWGTAGKRLKELVAGAAKEVDLNSGLLGTIMMAETRRPMSYLSNEKVSSYHIGTDDFFEARDAIAARVPAFAKVKWEKTQSPIVHLNDAPTPREVKTIFFDSGSDAALATAVYIKFREVRLREISTELKGDFDRLPIETRFALSRMAMAAGTAGATPFLKDALAGKDIMVRKPLPVKIYQTQRNATVRTAQAMHLSEWIFGLKLTPISQPEVAGSEVFLITQEAIEAVETGKALEAVAFEDLQLDGETDDQSGDSGKAPTPPASGGHRATPVPAAGTGVAPQYDAEAAVAYARKFWNRPCTDLRIAPDLEHHPELAHRGFIDATDVKMFLKRPDEQAEDAVDVTCDPDAVDKKCKPVLQGTWDFLDDCTHFISCCIGRPPATAYPKHDTPKAVSDWTANIVPAGGLPLPSHSLDVSMYGISGLDRLLEFIISPARRWATVLAEKVSKDEGRKKIHLMAPGDLIAYSTIGDGRFDHLVVLLGDDGKHNEKVACHTYCRSDAKECTWDNKWDEIRPPGGDYHITLLQMPRSKKPTGTKAKSV